MPKKQAFLGGGAESGEAGAVGRGCHCCLRSFPRRPCSFTMVLSAYHGAVAPHSPPHPGLGGVYLAASGRGQWSAEWDGWDLTKIFNLSRLKQDAAR